MPFSQRSRQRERRIGSVFDSTLAIWRHLPRLGHWNARGLFALAPRSRQAKVRLLKRFLSKLDVCSVVETHGFPGDADDVFPDFLCVVNMVDCRKGGTMLLVRHAWLDSRSLCYQKLLPGRLARLRIEFDEGTFAFYTLHVEGDTHSVAEKVEVIRHLGLCLDASDASVVLGDWNFEPRCIEGCSSHQHRVLEEALRQYCSSLCLVSPSCPSYCGNICQKESTIDHVGLSLPRSAIEHLRVRCDVALAGEVLVQPPLSDHIPIKLWAAAELPSAPPALSAHLCKDERWLCDARRRLACYLSSCHDMSDRVRSVERACREAKAQLPVLPVVDARCPESNLYHARCLMRALLSGWRSRAEHLCKAAPQWGISLESPCLLSDVDKLLCRLTMDVVRAREHGTVFNTPMLEQRLADRKNAWASLFAHWRAQVVRPRLSCLAVDENLAESPQAIADSLFSFWEPLMTTVHKPERLLLKDILAFAVQPRWAPIPITSREQLLNRLRHAPSTSAGADGLRYSHLLALGSPLLELAEQLFVQWIEEGNWSDVLSHSWLVPIAKVGDCIPGPEAIRPIALSSCLSKLLAGELARWLYASLPESIHAQQFGFLPGRGTEGALLHLEQGAFCQGAIEENVACLFLDIQRAFPSLSHAYLYALVEASAAPRWFKRALEAMYSTLTMQFVVEGRLSATCTLLRGLRQGCPLSGLLFAWCTDAVIRWWHGRCSPDSCLSCFADDFALVVSNIIGRGANVVLILARMLDAVLGLCINHRKVRGLALSRSVCGKLFQQLSYLDERWALASEVQQCKYLGFMVGHSGSLWQSTCEKLRARADALDLLRVGAPALLGISKSLLWSIAHHSLAMFRVDSELEVCFRRLVAFLIKGPPQWLPHSVAIHLDKLGIRSPPPLVAELAFRLQVRALLRRNAWPLIRIDSRIRGLVFGDSAPLLPYLASWYQQSAHSNLMEVFRVASLHGLMTEEAGYVVARSKLQKTLVNKVHFCKLLRSVLSSEEGVLSNGANIIHDWLLRRVTRVFGRSFSCNVRVSCIMAHLKLLSKKAPPRVVNAAIRVVSDGIVLQPPEGLCHDCLLCVACGGRNQIQHYVSSLCWRNGLIMKRHPRGSNFVKVLSHQPSVSTTTDWGWTCFWLVRAINFARCSPHWYPNAVEYILRYPR